MTQHMRSGVTTDDGKEDEILYSIHQPKSSAKNSMDRFGDDLCALLLSYLSLEDRFRYECVSKRFQRTVFESVVDINIDNELFKHKSLENISLRQMFADIYNTLSRKKPEISFDTQLLTRIAIKCQNIQTIDCRGIPLCDLIIPDILNIFRDNCRHLREIHCDLRLNSDYLYHIYCPLITRINSLFPQHKQSLIHCYRLSRLRVHLLSDVFDNTSGQLLAKDLQKFEFSYKSSDNKELLSAFVAQNQSLKSLVVSVHQYSFGAFTQISTQLSQLIQLRELRLNSKLIDSENSLSESLRTIGLNCKQLQRLALELRSNNFQLNGQTLDSLHCYHRLKRLELTLYMIIDEEALEPLKLCHRLTHLIINSRLMSDKLLINCDKQWPRLQYLTIVYNDITRKCLSHISRLPALQMLVIKGLTKCPKDNDLCDVLSKSPKLKNIEIRVNIVSMFYCRKNVTNVYQ